MTAGLDPAGALVHGKVPVGRPRLPSRVQLAPLPENAYVAALAGLPHLTPSRLRWLLEGAEPAETWRRVLAGTLPGGVASADGGLGGIDQPGPTPEATRTLAGSRSRWTPDALARAWRAHAGSTDPSEVWATYRAAGVGVCVHGGTDYPVGLRDDPEAPPVLFWVGDLGTLDRPRVALVGTRACTHYGEEVAGELGLGLARAGVTVVSGLALGIDGAAHRGALAGGCGPPLGIVGSGLDVIYPPAHARLWRQVADRGALISEAPLRAAAEAWRFPWRNRLIAGLGDVVVVVESHRVGGALLTVEAAIHRGVSVLAVPGSVHSPASVGTNALIADGCPPARDIDDVLVALRLARPNRPVAAEMPLRPGHSPPGHGPLDGAQEAVWSALDDGPTPTDSILRRTGLTLGEVAVALDHLEEAGWVGAHDGWWERLDAADHAEL